MSHFSEAREKRVRLSVNRHNAFDWPHKTSDPRGKGTNALLSLLDKEITALREVSSPAPRWLSAPYR
ncbi:MAG: hypothetical protein PHW76_02495 [Alphaproteobacteria bacterium]|nr:hypothetical protein [Alphaproteobacteria bacterium]